MDKTSNYPAHIRIDENSEHIQYVEEHCRNTALLAQSALENINLANCAYTAGILHDLGKMKEEYRTYLLHAIHGKPARRGSVNHSFAGVKYLLNQYHGSDYFTSLTAELIAYAVGSHHGLFDCVGVNRRHGFAVRQNWAEEAYTETVQTFFQSAIPPDALEKSMQLAEQEIQQKYTSIVQMSECDPFKIYFYLGLLARLILSAVIEGDRTDTACFMSGASLKLPAKTPAPVWYACLQRIESRLDSFPCDKPVDRARRTISQICRNAADKTSGVYRLNLPTGSGKTLAALRFAAACAATNGKDRIIFTFPLLSILEQNADVIRKFVQDDSMVLEHHSNVVRTELKTDELQQQELLADNWQSPIIITTLVQLLNTLFSENTTAIRRFQSLCNSVIIIDEVQTVPVKMLSLFHLAVNFLANICNSVVVLCSATHPSNPNSKYGYFKQPVDLVPYSRELWDVFQRTQLLVAPKCTEVEIPGYVLETLRDTNSLLVICNKKSEAEKLYHALQNCGANCFHISAGMCIAHRRAVLTRLKTALANAESQKVLCIATQVLEAGVDISFGQAIRLLAGMDSIVQTAGRCNRNNEQDNPAFVHILECVDEKLKGLPDISAAQNATRDLLTLYQECPERYHYDLSSNEAIDRYYASLYASMKENSQNYPLKNHGTLLDYLSLNTKFADDDAENAENYILHQAFRFAGENFQVFDENTHTVIVPYGDAKIYIRSLEAAFAHRDFKKQQEAVAQLKPFSISILHYRYEQLQKEGGILSVCDGTVDLLCDALYDSETGLCSHGIQVDDYFI